MPKKPSGPMDRISHFYESALTHPFKTAHLVELGIIAPTSIMPGWKKAAAGALMVGSLALLTGGIALQDIEGLAMGGVTLGDGGGMFLEAGEKASHLPPGGGGAGPTSKPG